MKLSNVFLLCGWVMTSAVSAQPMQDASRGVSEGMSGVMQGSATVVGGSVNVLKATGGLVISGVEASGDAVVLTLKSLGQGVSEAGEVSLRVGAQTVGGVSFVVGTGVKAIAATGGWALYQGGRLVAFVPDALGQKLLHREKLG
ncbi:hypothetical protein [Niveibacterium sp. SC-1]|uniref:hypothetical protein n=1 Tax=Niveibacterium sp. SC-1 TaxID=3135646 RepID=UPI0031201F2B